MPTDPNANEEDLFDLAAKLAGCAPVDLLKVRRDPAGLVVILATGQKFIFDPAVIGEQLDSAIRAQLAAVLGLDPPPAPAPAPAKPKSKRGA
jgi:predicted NAD/FAD-binding protein